MWFSRHTGPCAAEQPPFPKGQTAMRGSNCAPGRRHGASGTTVRQVWKNTGSAVETEPHGETSVMGRQKTRDINRLARAALEREREIKAYGAEAADQGWFTRRPGRDACVAARARV